MKDSKNIDQLFQDKLSDFQVAPSEKVWSNIEAALKEKKKRRILPLWFKFSGVAAILLVSLFVTNQFLIKNTTDVEAVSTIDIVPKINSNQTESKKDNRRVVGKEEMKNPTNENNVPSVHQPAEALNRNQIATADTIIENKSVVKSRNKSVVANQTSRQNQRNDKRQSKDNSPLLNNVHSDNNKVVVANSNQKPTEVQKSDRAEDDSQLINKTYSDTNKIVANLNQNPTKVQKIDVGQNEEEPIITERSSNEIDKISMANDVKIDTTVVAAVVTNALEELLNEKEKEVPTSQEQKLNRWQITSSVAPVYFGSTSNGSPLDARFENNKKNYKPTASYGIGAAYILNKKLSIRAGINALAWEYNTNDIAISQSTSARKIENVNNNTRGNFIQVDNLPANSPSNFNKTAVTQYGGSLNQRTGYIEVPVALSYKLVDQKFGIALIGGWSTLFLNQNEVSIVSSGLEMTIGEANNLNDIHFSTNVGVGLKYSFLKSMEFNLEPMFKYQINTYSSDSGNFRPYFFGLYSGVSYRF